MASEPHTSRSERVVPEIATRFASEGALPATPHRHTPELLAILHRLAWLPSCTPSVDMGHRDEPRRCVYIIRSMKDPDRQYIGRTADIASRLLSHNAGESPQTARQAPWQVVVLVQFVDERRALDFEKFLKSGSGRVFVRQYFG